jgi:hypothetical protein
VSGKTCRDPLTGQRMPCIPSRSLQKIDTSGRVESPPRPPRLYGRRGSRLFFSSTLSWIRKEERKLIFTQTPGVVRISEDGRKVIVT